MRTENPTTTFDEVVSHFAGRSARAAYQLARWREDPGKKALVVPFVARMCTRVAYRQSTSTIERVTRETEHALANVSKPEAVKVEAVRDWHPAFALQHTLHYASETLGELPTYQAFRDFCARDSEAREMLYQPAQAAIRAVVADGVRKDAAVAAMRWRVGMAYYAYLKEMYALAVLREAGIDARYHVLADVLFRTDLWIGDTCLSIYVDNRLFKSAISGRKPKAEDVLGDGPFRFARLELATRQEFGTVHLPRPDELVDLVREHI